jgi:hypothetical protein
MRKALWIVVVGLMALSVVPVVAQDTEPDPEIQAAKEETAVVYDLGRFFGYVWRLEQEYDDLALNSDQMAAFYEVMTDISSMARIEPDWAEDTYEYLELDVLDMDQLMQVDMFVIAREETRSSGTGTGAGSGSSSSGSGSGPILSYINGGAFNPIVESTNTQGEDFAEFMEYLKDNLGR